MFEKLGIQLYTIRDYMKTPEEADVAFGELAKLGYTEAHTAGTGFDEKLYYELLTKHGISICGTHVGCDEIFGEPERMIELHNMWNTKNIGVGSMPSPAKKSPEALKAFIADFNRAAEQYAKHGFRLTYHNHSFEFMRIDGFKTLMDYLYEGLDPVNTSFVLDTCWVAAAAADVCDWIYKLEGRIDILHIKDATVERDPNAYRWIPKMCEVGYGNMSWDRILKAAEDIGVKHYVVEQDGEWLNNPMDSARMSAEYLKKFMK